MCIYDLYYDMDRGSDVQLKKSQRKVVRLRDVLEALKVNSTVLVNV